MQTKFEITFHHELPQVQGNKPNSAWAEDALEALRQNALSFDAHHEHGFLRLTTDEATYKEMTGSQTDFTPPVKPTMPTFTTETAAAVSKAMAEYNENIQKYLFYKEVDRKLVGLITASVPPECISTLKDPKLGKVRF